MSNLSCFSLFFFCNFKYLFEKVKISLIGGIARHTRYFKVVQSKVGAGFLLSFSTESK